MTDSTDHKNIVRDEFTKQADAYAANSRVTDSEQLDRLVSATDPSPEARVLEVATGPGHVAFAFAEKCREVIGVDLTEAPLAIAEQTRRKCGLNNVHFQKGDADNLPFKNCTFDIVVCRFAFHHFENPSRVLQQMVNVSRPNGTIAVADLVVSEHPHRGAYQNQFEQLRDPSHVRAHSLSELIELGTETELEIEDVSMGSLVPEVEQWLSEAQTPSSRAREVREMIERDATEDLSGTRPFWQDGKLYFTQRTAVVVGRKLKNAVKNAEKRE